jgi:hypothetical protein
MTTSDLPTTLRVLASRCAGEVVPDDAEALLELISEAETLKSALCALQARAAVVVDRSAELALARRVSPHRGRQLLGLARALCGDYPQTMARLAEGAIDEDKALAIVRETSTLSPEDRAGVDDAVCGRASELEGVGIRELTDRARALSFELDPDGWAERVRRAEEDRHVRFRARRDGMCSVTALVPTASGAAMFQRLTTTAAALRAEGDGRTTGQAMADVLVQAVTGSASGLGSVCLNIVMTDVALAGGPEAAWIEGTPVPAEVARHLASRAITDEAATWFRRLYADHGRLVAMTTRKRVFSGALAEFLRIRDRTCRTPYCNAPIKHLDHVLPHSRGGPTSAENGQGLCEACNQAKGSTGPPGRTWDAAA